MEKVNGSAFDKVIENSALIEMKAGIESNNKLGVTQEYKNNRSKFDNSKLREEYKNDAFGNKKTIKDSLTGSTIHKDHKAAQRKYKRQSTSTEWASHASETDHIVSLERGHSRLKKNPFLSDQNVNDILNDKKYNYREVSKSYNASKGERSDFTKLNELPNEGKVQVVKDNIKAETGIIAKTTILTTKNMGNEFAQGAVRSLEAAAIPIMIEGVHNLYLVANGEKKFDEAAKDMGKLTTQVAVSGGGIQVITTGVSNVLKNGSSEVLKKIGSSNYVGQIISVSLILCQSISKYVNGEINGEEFFKEIGEKGVGLVSGAIGAIIGQAVIPIPYVGVFIGSMIISTACMGLYRTYSSLNEHQKKLKRVSSIASQALAEMSRQRAVLQDMIGEQFANWDEQFHLGFEEIFDATMVNDVNGISSGLDRILNVFGGAVQFKTFDEFDEFFMNEDATFSF